MLKNFVLGWLGLLIGNAAFAQVPHKSTLDSAVNSAALRYLKNHQRVGVSLGLVVNNQTYVYNFGETAPGNAQLPTAQSIYEIGSITKTFTGLLVAHAVKEGRMKLTDDIRKFLPSGFDHLQYPNGDPVKIIYLVAHVAKFPNSFADEEKSLANEESFLKELRELKLDSLKGFKYAYSNVGYQLLGYILESIYQMSYQDLVQKYITLPLGMKHTKVHFSQLDQAQYLTGYNLAKEKAPAMRISFPAAGGLRSTVNDMLQYMKYQLAEPDEMVKLSHRITSGNIDEEAHAFQWAIGKLWNWDYYMRIDGGTKGFRSFCTLYPDYKIGVVILTNQTDEQAGGDLYRLTSTIFNELKKRNTKP